jgi:Tfp pilus assembly protein PilF
MAETTVHTNGRKFLYLNGVLLAAVLFAFLPSIENDFVGYDDPDYVTANPWVQRGLSAATVRWAFKSTEFANWHPLTWLSHMLDVQLFGLSPTGHHLTSLLINSASTLLAFNLLFSITGAIWRSFFVAALFGLHPLRVESVAWAAERKDVLSVFFWMLTLIAYARYARAAQERRRALWYMLAILSFAVGLMAKSMLVTLPFVMLLLDWWPLARVEKGRLGRLLIEKMPFFGLTAAASIVTFLVQRTGGAVNEGVALFPRFINVLVSYVRYVGKLFVPLDLAFFYPPQNWPLWSGALALVALTSVTVAGMMLSRRQPAFFIGWLWFLGTFVPVIGIVIIGQHSIADRYTYIPSFGFFVALVWGVHAAVASRPKLQMATSGMAAVALLACIFLTRQQISQWHDTQTLCRHAIKVTTGNYIAHDMLGAALEKAGHREEAMREHLESLRINPKNADAHNNLGVAYQHQGDLQAAVRELGEAIRLRPNHAEAYYNLGVALSDSGQLDKARESYLRALAIRPFHVNSHFNLGNLYFREGKLDQAAMEFQRTLEIAPNSSDALNNLGVISDRLNQLDQSIGFYQRAMEVKPDDPKTYLNLGLAFQRKGLPDLALQFVQEAVRLNPEYTEAKIAMASMLSQKTNAGAQSPK